MSNALERGLHVLEILAERGEARVADIMTELAVSRATAFRIITTLESRGYVEHVKHKPVWRLGRVVGELAATVDSDEIVRLAGPALADLGTETGETVNLATLHRNRVVWSATLQSSHALRLSTIIGEAVPVHATAIGKALLSTLPRQDWARLLPPEPFPALTPHTRRSMAQLVSDVEQCRQTGWALDEEESELSGVCVAAAITGRDGRAVAAISVSSVAGRLPTAERPRLGLAVRSWCDRTSALLSRQSGPPATDDVLPANVSLAL